MEEEADPMSSVANLVDAMLVVAVGLMMALVVRGDIQLNQMEQIDPETMVPVDVENVEEMIDDFSTSSGMQEAGTLYVDPETGTTYVLKEEAAAGAASNASGTSPSSAASSSQSATEGEVR